MHIFQKHQNYKFALTLIEISNDDLVSVRV